MNMKIVLIFGTLLLSVGKFLLPQSVRIVRIPDEVKAVENEVVEVYAHNMSGEEIYRAHRMYISNNYIYLASDKPVEMIKLSLNGEVVGRVGRKGQGPGEFLFIFGIYGFGKNIYILDTRIQKLVIYNDGLEFVKEYKLRERYSYCLIDNKKSFVLYGRPSADYYFSVYSERLKFLRYFGRSMTSASDNMKKFSFDLVRYAVYVQEEDGIWACFKNRYDLRYYKQEKLIAEIKAKTGFFSGKEQDNFGRKYMEYKDKSLHLAKDNNRLYYLYNKDNRTYCDIFDLSDYKLMQRLKFAFKYIRIVYHKENTFYALRYDKNEDRDVLFVRLKTQLKIKEENHGKS